VSDTNHDAPPMDRAKILQQCDGKIEANSSYLDVVAEKLGISSLEVNEVGTSNSFFAPNVKKHKIDLYGDALSLWIIKKNEALEERMNLLKMAGNRAESETLEQQLIDEETRKMMVEELKLKIEAIIDGINKQHELKTAIVGGSNNGHAKNPFMISLGGGSEEV